MHCSPELFQAHKTIAFFEPDKQRISDEHVRLYKQGLSLSDISKQTGKSKSTIRENLIRAGVELRSDKALPIAKLKAKSGKTKILPPYGFCYFQGRIVPNPKEHENLLLIYHFWKSSTNPNRIADTLNTKEVPPRFAKFWNRNSVVNLLNRFEKNEIIYKGGTLELR